MIKRNVGLLRKAFTKRHDIVRAVKQVLDAENLLTIEFSNHQVNISGHTESTATTVLMLGRAIGSAYFSALEELSGLEPSEFLAQPVNVAIRYIQQVGIDTAPKVVDVNEKP